MGSGMAACGTAVPLVVARVMKRLRASAGAGAWSSSMLSPPLPLPGLPAVVVVPLTAIDTVEAAEHGVGDGGVRDGGAARRGPCHEEAQSVGRRRRLVLLDALAAIALAGLACGGGCSADGDRHGGGCRAWGRGWRRAGRRCRSSWPVS